MQINYVQLKKDNYNNVTIKREDFTKYYS